VVQIFTAIGTAVALILLAFGYISPAAGDNEAEARGVTNFDSITLSEDLVVGDDVTITGALSVGGDDMDAIYAASTTVTGTLAVTSATHGLSAITAAGCTLGRNTQHRLGRARPVLGRVSLAPRPQSPLSRTTGRQTPPAR
jgi:hypothetical protein